MYTLCLVVYVVRSRNFKREKNLFEDNQNSKKAPGVNWSGTKRVTPVFLKI